MCKTRLHILHDYRREYSKEGSRININTIIGVIGLRCCRENAQMQRQGGHLGFVASTSAACIPADVNKETTMFTVNVFIEKVNRSHEAGNSTKESKFSKPCFKFGHVNARNLYPKTDEINAVVVKHDFDVFCVSETWLGERFKDNDVEIPDYNIYRKDRVDALGGGVYLYQEPSHH